MGQHSYIELDGHQFLHCRDGYFSDLAALFTERERRVVHSDEDGTEFAYATTVMALRERLTVQGFTAARSRHDLADALGTWARVHPSPDGDSQPGGADIVGHQPTSVQEWSQLPAPSDWAAPVPTVLEIEDAFRQRLAIDLNSVDFDDLLIWPDPDPLYVLLSYISDRNYLRLLLDCAPDDSAEVRLNLSELTYSCRPTCPSPMTRGPNSWRSSPRTHH